MTRISEIKARLEASTAGPWDDAPATEEWKANKAANFDVCRHAPSDIAYLLDLLGKAADGLNVISEIADVLESGSEDMSDVRQFTNEILYAREALAAIRGEKS